MGIWVFMTVCALLIPVVLIFGGRFMWKRTPKSINRWVGYRTDRSMKSPEAWRFANRCCGRLWWRMGWASLPVSAAGMLLTGSSGEEAQCLVMLVLMGAQMVLLFGSIYLVERALQANFDSQGQPRKDPDDRAATAECADQNG